MVSGLAIGFSGWKLNRSLASRMKSEGFSR
jgi:hypothetical protein